LDKPKQTQKELRDLVKRGEYGGFYGGAIQTLFNSIVKEFPEVTITQVARIVQIIANRMPGVGRWHNDLMRRAVQEKEIRSAILGRRRCFPLGNADPTVVRNFPVQATAADIMNLGIIRVVDALTERGYYDIESWEFNRAELILQVHDSIVFEVDEEIAEEVRDIMTERLTQTHKVGGASMVFPAEASVGRSWADVG
jgi:DNA polymerase I-like protein with 3'-5' exonuclease and polymerase domains